MSSRRSADVAALEREDKIDEAAELAERLEHFEDAAELWERACRFDHAASASLRAGDASRALLLAARAHDIAAETRAIEALLADPEQAHLAAERVSLMGQPQTAARLKLRLGDSAGAAREFESAQAWLEAARAHGAAGDARSAARAYEILLEREPDLHHARIELAELLCQHARVEAAMRVLQQVPRAAAERRAALALLVPGLRELGLLGAADELEPELTELGGEIRALPRAATSGKSAPGQLLFGRYEVVRSVATTPTARVFEALDRVTAERVAIKLFAAGALRDAGRDALARFEREAVALGRLRHAAIVPLREYLPEGPAVVLRWMEGGSLAELLAREAIAPARAAEITRAVLGALGEAHRRGILHRDIKPANVLFDAFGAAHLADFGTAHVSDAAATITVGVIGTLAYMAPEQRAGAPASVKSDVFGAGALFWHALTGGAPDRRLQFLSPDLSDAARVVAEKLIAPEPQRPVDVAAALAAIASASWPEQAPPQLAGEPLPAPPEPRHERLEPLGANRHRDRLLEREVHVLPADPETLERARCFARADHPGLATVLAQRGAEGTLWIEALDGGAAAPLRAGDIVTLRAALEALHRAGGVHGVVDELHLARRGGQIVLCFPLTASTGSAEEDRAALERLAVKRAARPGAHEPG